jgi:crotonobetainyl-CoA:carnitine CoA-transferase CaiB-like acyl-CoA transferase
VTAPVTGAGPLDGVSVLDFSRVLSGPHCGRMLADMGADVVKIEPPEGDLTRFFAPRIGGLATYFMQQNTGKRNISLDLRHPKAVELLRQLASTADVVIENFRPSVMERMGLGHAVLCSANPRLVYCSISGYGHTGPWSNRRAYAAVIGAESGYTQMQADARSGSYATDVFSHADVYTGMEAAAAILAALVQRGRTGRGQWVEVSMLETMLFVNEHVQWELHALGAASEASSFPPGDFPVLVTAEGHAVATAGHPAARGTFERYIKAIGKPELASDPRFDGTPQRLANLRQLIDEMQAWASAIDDLDVIEAAFAENGIAMGVVRSVQETAASDWAAARGAIVELPDRSGGTVAIPNSPWHFSDAVSGARGAAAYRGEHNREVLSERLGLTEEELDELDAAGVLSSRLPAP